MQSFGEGFGSCRLIGALAVIFIDDAKEGQLTVHSGQQAFLYLWVWFKSISSK
ncbi:hypothetical protein [Peribacillus frigoritolerans]|uniref:hypothetical protein n=1 Tax=Peribacillus frigoritolerans TaxID=450367 RepID=UPI000A434A5A